MRKDLEFIINYQGLGIGKHSFTFNIGDSFFDKTEEREFSDPEITVDVQLQRDHTMMVFTFTHEGTIGVVCDRCLDGFRQSLKGSNALIVNFGDETDEEDDTIITLSRSEYEINLAPYIREYILLSLPWKNQCAGAGKKCNPEMTAKLKSMNTISDDQPEETDPRWEALRNIKFDK